MPATVAAGMRELVLVGGGHAHVQVLRGLALRPLPGFRLTVVLDRPVAIYSGMVPGFVAGRYEVGELEIDVVPLARLAGARVVLAAAVGVEAGAGRIRLEGRPPIRFDVASFDIGSTVAGLELPGVREHALPTRPISALVERVEEIEERARQHAVDGPFRVVIVGGGAGGVELAFTFHERLKRATGRTPRVTLLQGDRRILSGFPSGLGRRAERAAAARGIRLRCGQRVVAVRPRSVVVAEAEPVAADAVVWVVGAVGQPLFRDSNLPTDERGFVWTRSTLQVDGYEKLFAVGDCATLQEHPETPKAGVYAVRQGPLLLENLRRLAGGRPLRRYRPQRDFLTLLNLGDGTALGGKWGLSFAGRWVMELKDGIDRRFMRRFQVLDERGRMREEFAAMAGTPAGEGSSEGAGAQRTMSCGGCAAKLPQDLLRHVLGRLEKAAEDPGLALGMGAADDAAAWSTPSGDLVVTSIDGFRSFAQDPYLLGRVSAINALSDVHATGGRPRYAQALVVLPIEAGSEAAEEVLYQVLAGAQAAFEREGVRLVGGHTTTGPELLAAFAVEGIAASREALLRQDALAPGDVLVLTKPLGTGVVLAADRRGRAPGRWLEAALRSMLCSNRTAARIAAECGARAVTDVTGFGLIGHLGSMLAASGVAARLVLERLPALPGALELLVQGIRSSAHVRNARGGESLRVSREAAGHPAMELLADPQTSGGLLVGIAEGRERALRERLLAAGVPAAQRIGTIRPWTPGEARIEIEVQ